MLLSEPGTHASTDGGAQKPASSYCRDNRRELEVPTQPPTTREHVWPLLTQVALLGGCINTGEWRLAVKCAMVAGETPRPGRAKRRSQAAHDCQFVPHRPFQSTPVLVPLTHLRSAHTLVNLTGITCDTHELTFTAFGRPHKQTFFDMHAQELTQPLKCACAAPQKVHLQEVYIDMQLSLVLQHTVYTIAASIPVISDLLV